MIDSHAHLTSPQVLPDVDAVVERAKAVGVETLINICTDRPSLEEGIKLAKRCKRIYNTAATTPHDVEEDGEAFFPLVEKAVSDLVAIGETGLDYFYEHSPKKMQQHYLSRYFELAKKVNLPVIFHCRDAFEDLFAISDEQYRDRKAVLHCFTGTIEEARGCLDRGWFVSFSGIITYKKSELLREVVKYVPLDRIFIETDTPYLAPQSKRGKQNEPAYVIETAEKIAALKECDLKVVEKVTGDNISQFFALK
ncbi:MAG: putative metal-dependent hydrolase YcfH [Chlamydiae bacterium]|nr:putative metal-dependent hydrolase YcfH [Chlamydiota bacterium]